MLMPDDRADRFVHKQTMTREIAAAAANVTLLNACHDSHPRWKNNNLLKYMAKYS
jgi:hypothetical protein